MNQDNVAATTMTSDTILNANMRNIFFFDVSLHGRIFHILVDVSPLLLWYLSCLSLYPLATCCVTRVSLFCVLFPFSILCLRLFASSSSSASSSSPPCLAQCWLHHTIFENTKIRVATPCDETRMVDTFLGNSADWPQIYAEDKQVEE